MCLCVRMCLWLVHAVEHDGSIPLQTSEPVPVAFLDSVIPMTIFTASELLLRLYRAQHVSDLHSTQATELYVSEFQAVQLPAKHVPDKVKVRNSPWTKKNECQKH